MFYDSHTYRRLHVEPVDVWVDGDIETNRLSVSIDRDILNVVSHMGTVHTILSFRLKEVFGSPGDEEWRDPDAEKDKKPVRKARGNGRIVNSESEEEEEEERKRGDRRRRRQQQHQRSRGESSGGSRNRRESSSNSSSRSDSRRRRRGNVNRKKRKSNISDEESSNNDDGVNSDEDWHP